jgi:hypothetical protein
LQLIHVSPGNVGTFWPHVSPGIKEAMRRGGLGSFGYVERCVLGGQMDLWLAFDGKVHACAVTDICDTEWKRVCVITANYGHKAKSWIHLLDEIENWARERGCTATRIMGRYGWQRLLPAYRATRIVLEKAL